MKLLAGERVALHKLLRVPMNSFSKSAILNFASCGCPKFTGIAATAAAAASRAALRTLTTWKGWCSKLRQVSWSHGPAIPAALDRVSPPCWDTPPLAFFLEEAASPDGLRASKRPELARVLHAELSD